MPYLKIKKNYAPPSLQVITLKQQAHLLESSDSTPEIHHEIGMAPFEKPYHG